jgi:superfamily I DNA/RNA helicase
MARKKKEKNYELSNYQLAIIDFIKNGQGNLVVEASAGSGKTYTLLKCLEEIPGDKNILLTAFNSDIAGVLKRKAKDFYNVNVSTLHSLGRQMLQRNFTEAPLTLDEFKYKSYINTNIKTLSSINTYELSKKDFARYMSNIEDYINFGRAYLCQTVKDLDFIEDRYDIDTIADEKEIALDALEYGKHNLEQIDFTDMIWLPNVLFCKPLGMQFDWIFLDEAQDLSVCQREILLKCRKINTRMCFFGDSEQALYSFASSDPESFKRLKELPNTKSLPLSISYRCANNIVNFAQKIVPTIECNNDGREGEIRENVPLSDINDGDMVLCRNNAPLMQVYVSFIKEGKKCFIRGKDIGANLKTIVKSVKQDRINADCKEDGLFVRLYDDLFVTRNKIMERSGIDSKTAMTSPIIDNKLDMIKALEILSEGLVTTAELINKIDEIFPKKDKKDGIALSTIHKAKGLEANNVYIACRSLMPSKSAKKDWEIKQEHNLMYVAYTRSKNILGFIDEKDFKDFDVTNTLSQAKLDRIEAQVNKVLGKTTKIIINENTAKIIIENAKKLGSKEPAKRSVSITTGRTVNSFSDIFKNKKQVRTKRL